MFYSPADEHAQRKEEEGEEKTKKNKEFINLPLKQG